MGRHLLRNGCTFRGSASCRKKGNSLTKLNMIWIMRWKSCCCTTTLRTSGPKPTKVKRFLRFYVLNFTFAISCRFCSVVKTDVRGPRIAAHGRKQPDHQLDVVVPAGRMPGDPLEQRLGQVSLHGQSDISIVQGTLVVHGYQQLRIDQSQLGQRNNI